MGWAMADKDKKKLKVILKLPKPPLQLKSPVVAANSTTGLGFTAPASQFVTSQDYRRNVQSHHAASSSAHSASFSSVRSATAASRWGTFAASPSPHGASPPAHAPTPPKKRKFKSVEQTGALGVGAIVVGAPSAPAAVESLVSTKDAGGVPAAHAPITSPLRKSHKKQVKPPIRTDGFTANSVAGAFAQPQALLEPISKSLLEGVLDKLQKKDTYGVFAEPVDPSQVPDYYDIIKEPMDFGTMRKKIKKGSYASVEVFEGDIYLICSNAMRYNGPDTIYYKQARAIRDMARKALEIIRAQLSGEFRRPVSHKKKPPPPKKSHAKKPTPSKARFDGAGSDFASGATLAADGELVGWSNSTVDLGKAKKGVSIEKLVGMSEDSEGAWAAQPVGLESKVETQEDPAGASLKPMGPKDGRRPLSTDEYHRNTYKPRLLPAHGQGPPLVAIGGELRQLLPVGLQVEHAYAKSLAQFGAALGPSAWRFVARKLQKCLAPSVPFGPGWVGEQEASTVFKNAFGDGNHLHGLQVSHVAAGSSSTSTTEKTKLSVSNGVLPGIARASEGSISTATKAITQGWVDRGPPLTKTLNGPHMLASVPQMSASLPQMLANLPQMSANVPQMPGTASQIPASVPRMLGTIAQLSASLSQMPANGPQMLGTVLQMSASVPQMLGTVTQMSASVPQMLGTGPQISTNVPQMLGTVPQMSASVPQMSSNALHMSANVPQMLGTVPQMSASVPQMSSNALHMTANVPQLLVPQVSANIPQMSANGPEMSSSLPQISANTPQMSDHVSANVQQTLSNVSQIPPNVPQILQPYVYADYNQFFLRLPPQQSSVMLVPSLSNPQTQVQQADDSVAKFGGSEQIGMSNFHPQLNTQSLPSPQQSSLQQRPMPPDLNVALVSPSALQSPQAQQGSTPRNAHQLDLKLQL